MDAVGQPSQRQAGEGIEQPERRPLQQPDLGVADPQVMAQRLDEQAHHLAIDKGDRIGDDEHGDRAPSPQTALLRRQPRLA